jgi:hypothetical protein
MAKDEVKDFGKPLNEWTTEQVPVTRKSFNEQTGQWESTETIESRRVKYLHVPKEKYRCKQGEHIFRVLSKSKYIFGCVKCQYSRLVYPGIYRLTSEGKLQHIASGKFI